MENILYDPEIERILGYIESLNELRDLTANVSDRLPDKWKKEIKSLDNVIDKASIKIYSELGCRCEELIKGAVHEELK